MTFTDSNLLAALVALAIPVLVHLWGRRRARRMVLPTVRFAEAAHQAGRAAAWLRRAALLALRLAAVALLVLALAGPRIEGDNRADQNSPSPLVGEAAHNSPSPLVGEGSAVRGTAVDHPHPASPPSPIKGEGMLPTSAPIRVLIVDAEAAGEGVHSADLVAATFTGDTNIPKQVTLAKSNEIEVQDLATADVVFWIGKQPDMFAWLIEWPDRPDLFSPQSKFLGDYLTSGGRLVWIPGSTPPAAKSVRNMPHPSIVQDARAGITIDPDGYMSDLLAAFEGGTSGDLSAPLFRHRIYRFPLLYGPVQQTTSPDGVSTISPSRGADPHTVVQFYDGSPAMAEYRIGRGRVVALAFGPDPYWGDLAGRQEFVVLMHSLAEALAPRDATNYPSPLAGEGPGVRGQGQGHPHPASPPSPIEGEGKQATDLTLWFILALGVVLVAEGLLAAASVPRGNAPPPGK